jgi:hypothetical protein
MSFALRHALALLLSLSAMMAAGEAGCELHLIKVGDIPDFVTLKALPSGEVFRMEAPQGYFLPAQPLPQGARVSINGEKPKGTVNLGEVSLPASGRHLLLLMPAAGKDFRRVLLPTDAQHLPKGSVGFLNLTSRKLRCYLDAAFVEVPPGESMTHPSISDERRIVNHRILSADADKWKPEGSTTLILGANRRYLIVVTEEGAKGPIRRDMITDPAPDVNMAPLVKPEPPVTAEPPLPDQPAK